jgi:hypothetical protein
VCIVDPVSNPSKGITITRPHLDRLHSVSMIFDRTMRRVNPLWNDDIYNWRTIYPNSVPKLEER